MGIKVSVIMGVRNCEVYLEQSIKSVISQTFTNWELIICDDGSNDCTYAIAQKYCDIDHRIILLRNDMNLGLSATLNKCLEYAKGDYIARQDGDDVSDCNRFARQIEFLENNPEFVMVCCDCSFFDDNGVWGYLKHTTIPEKKHLIFHPPFAHGAMMIRASIFRELGGYKVKNYTYRSQDYDLYFQVYSHDWRGYNLSEVLYNIRSDHNAYSRKKFKYRLHEMIIRYNGYKAIKAPFWDYIFVFKPLLLGLIPNKIIKAYHKFIFSN